jgi:hypothetical protein
MIELHEAINDLNFAVNILCIVLAIKCAVTIWGGIFEIMKIRGAK